MNGAKVLSKAPTIAKGIGGILSGIADAKNGGGASAVTGIAQSIGSIFG